MEQSIVTIIIIAVVFIVAAQYLQTQNPQFGIGGDGPLATGSGDAAIKNPQPIAESQSAASRAPSENQTTNGTQKTVQPKPGYSSYENTVLISRIQRSADRAKEYAVIRNGTYFNRAEASVRIAGWTIESRSSGRITILAAYEIPFIDADKKNILLPPKGEVIILTGSHAFGEGFRENLCTGYFNQNYSFVPPLANSCPAYPLDVQKIMDLGFNAECADFITKSPRCRVPVIPSEKVGLVGTACIAYVVQNLSYPGCVANFRDEKTFFKNTWRVFLNQPAHIFDTLHDRVILRDDKGLIVDEFEY